VEISSLRWSTNFLQRDHSRNKVEKASPQETRSGQPAFQISDTEQPPVNFLAITPKDLRVIALENYKAGQIDQETFITLSQELPSHAVDSQGRVIDLSEITDETDFDFHDYYRSVVAFLES
jgi:hypothetical protein